MIIERFIYSYLLFHASHKIKTYNMSKLQELATTIPTISIQEAENLKGGRRIELFTSREAAKAFKRGLRKEHGIKGLKVMKINKHNYCIEW